MKRLMVPAALLATCAIPLFTGCVEHRTVYVQTPPPAPPPTEVVVAQAPPTPPPEVIIAAPGPNYVWVPGYYAWHGRWVWTRGAWVVRPRAHAVWVPGYWGRHGHGYVWVGGHWR